MQGKKAFNTGITTYNKPILSVLKPIKEQYYIAPADTTAAETAFADSAKAAKPKVLTPKEVLSWLPYDATPEQQDSAIQAHFKPDSIHWSTRPDTLHLPCHSVGKDVRIVDLPLYYRESFFSQSPSYHPEMPAGRPGVAGAPVPYTIASDDLLTSLLLGCFILGCVAFAQSRDFIFRQVKHFFRVRNEGTSEIAETTGEIRFQIFLALQTSLLYAILFFLYLRHLRVETFIAEQFVVIGILTGLVAGYFLLKAFAQWFVGWVFFGKRKNNQWLKSFLFLVSSQGVLLLPLVMLQAYFQLTVKSSIIYVGIVLGTTKILSLYKTHLIFFRQKGQFLQFFLYFCALEIVPLFALWGVLTIASNYLKINF